MAKYTIKSGNMSINITDVINTGNTDPNGIQSKYLNFPLSYIENAWSRPGNLGYKINTNTDISEYCTAKFVDYNESTSVVIPGGVNYMKVICIGGGGGGGGGNGSYRPYSKNKEYRATQSGSSGNNGVHGSYVTSLFNRDNNTYHVSVGGGGAGGVGGNVYDGDRIASDDIQPRGSAGTSGTATSFTYNNILTAGGGAGGNQSYDTVREAPTHNIGTPSGLPVIFSGEYGKGGAGGTSGGRDHPGNVGGTGAAGNPGRCRVYYFYS